MLNVPVKLTVDLLIVGGTVKGCELALREKQNQNNVLLVTSAPFFGDDICSYFDFRNLPELLQNLTSNTLPTPVEIKHFLDQYLIKNKIPFLLQTTLLGIVEDCAILANCDGLFAVRTRAIVDATVLYSACRQSNIGFETFSPGPQRAIYRYLLECSDSEADYCCENRFYKLQEATTDVNLDAITPESLAQASRQVRLLLWQPEQDIVADRICFPDLPTPCGEDPAHLVIPFEQYSGILRSREELGQSQTISYSPTRTIQSDIAVIGGGTAGAAAAIPGGKAGLKTVVIERLSRPGGLGTQGRIACYWYGLRNGFTEYLDDQVNQHTVKTLEHDRMWHVESKQHVWEKENANAGVLFLTESFCCYSFTESGDIHSVLVATEFGGITLQAKEFIDCTGNAVLAALSGAPTVYADPLEPALQGSGMSPVVPGHDYYNSDYMFTVDSDNQDVTRALIEGRTRCQKLFDCISLPGTRERRRIAGEVVLKAVDFYANKSYPDTVVLASSNFDTHGFTVDPLLLYRPTDESAYVAEIPFRAMLSPGISNLMSTGLSLSAQRDALPLIRMEADVQNQGYVAGMLATEAVLSSRPLRSIDLPKVQKALKEMGFMDRPEFAQFKLNEDARIFADGNTAQLENEYRNKPDFEKALQLALLGSTAGTELLQQTIQNSPWDEGWHYRGMGQFGMSSSRFDAALLAMAKLPDQKGEFLLPRLQDLHKESCFSHIRAVCMFLMHHPEAELADQLEQLLQEFGCHAVNNWEALLEMRYSSLVDVEERNFQLKELYLAGAIHACNPTNSLAINILERYRTGLHKLYAVYAEQWL